MKHFILPTKGLAEELKATLEEAFDEEEYQARLMGLVMNVMELMSVEPKGDSISSSIETIEYCFSQLQSMHEEGFLTKSAIEPIASIAFTFASELLGILIGAGLAAKSRRYDFAQFVGNDIMVRLREAYKDAEIEDMGDIPTPDTDD